ncbi:MAG: hypothetical protein LUI07_00775 [Lachnospiraceae bacterium]|nr:hypothetical protein [Lachnospiraceae bacterium]
MSFRKAKAKEKEKFSGWLMSMLGEIDPAFLNEDIPERDLEKMEPGTALQGDARMRTEAVLEREPAEQQAESPTQKAGRGGSWQRVALASGFAAAVSAALTGVIVLVCVRHSSVTSGVKNA